MAEKAKAAEWKTGQESVMREYAHLGVEGVKAKLKELCGVERSVSAIKMQASRRNVSLAKKTQCPQCHALGVRLNRQTGLCVRCNRQLNIEQQKIYNEMLEKEREMAENPDDLEELGREYDMLRQQASRLKRKHGLKTRKRDLG